MADKYAPTADVHPDAEQRVLDFQQQILSCWKGPLSANQAYALSYVIGQFTKWPKTSPRYKELHTQVQQFSARLGVCFPSSPYAGFLPCTDLTIHRGIVRRIQAFRMRKAASPSRRG